MVTTGDGTCCVEACHARCRSTLANGSGESEGATTISVTVSHDATAPQTVTDAVNVSDPNVVASGVPAFSRTEERRAGKEGGVRAFPDQRNHTLGHNADATANT